MDTKNIIKFYSKSKTFTELSNFYLQSFELDKNSFISGEHAFHYFKYKLMSVHSTDTRRKNELEMYSRKFVGLDPYFKSPLDAKKAGGKKHVVTASDCKVLCTVEDEDDDVAFEEEKIVNDNIPESWDIQIRESSQ